MAAVTEVVEFVRRLANGNTVRVGNQVQITDGDGNPVGASAGGYTATVTRVLDIATNYAAGDMIGSGATALADAALVNGGRLRLDSIHITDKAGQAPALTIYILNASPLGGTYTDNVALVWGSGDAAKQQGVVSVAAADYVTVAGVSAQSISNIGQVHVPAETSLHILVVANGAYNAAAVDDLVIRFNWTRL